MSERAGHRGRGVVDRIVTSPKLLSAAAVLLVASILSGLAALHIEQQREMARLIETADHLRTARLDLAQGFLHISLDGNPDAPFDRRQGYALIAQGIAALERESGLIGDYGPTARSLRAAVDTFKDRFSEWSATPGRRAPGTELRIAFHALGSHADRVDEEMRRQATELARSNDRMFALAIGAALLILAGIFVIVMIVSRAQERSVKQLRDSERRLQAYGEHLEETVKGRTRELEEANRAILGHAGELEQLSEQLRRRAQEAEAATTAKTNFLANMSHEIRTPLHAVIGFAHLARRHAESPRQRDFIDKISSASNHLLAIINDILDLSKIEAGMITLDAADVALGAVMERAVALVADRAREKSLRLDLDKAGVGDVAVRTDGTRLTQLLLNYLANAIKFTDAGAVTLSGRIVGETADDLTLRFEVRDTGIGISPERQTILFHPFVQVDDSSSRRFGGTGLGLAINKKIAALMGGDAGLVSVPGLGSTFWATVTLRKASAPRIGAPRVESSQSPSASDETRAGASAESRLANLHRGARILLVEDSPINREVAFELLAAPGLDVAIAESGREAVGMAQHAHYDAVLMDVQMPDLDGMEATRAIRKLPGWASTPILALSANAFAEDRAVCLEAGMNDHIAKPVDPETLYEALCRWLPASAAGMPASPVIGPTRTAPGPSVAHGDIPGLDRMAGLKHTGGDADRHVRFLRRFAHEHRGDPGRLAAMVKAGDVQGAMLLAHTLKGLCATLGFTKMSQSALELETELRRGGAAQALNSAVSTLATQLAQACDAIDLQILEASSHPDSATTGPR